MNLRLALPKGEIQGVTGSLLAEAGMLVEDYGADSRAYRLRVTDHPGISVKVFQEKDIAIQVAIGNYDLGICRSEWVEELRAKYRNVPILRIADLGYGTRTLFAACGRDAGTTKVEELSASNHGRPVRLVSEYPNLTERFALEGRFPRFSVFSVWGAAEAYPPEHAEIAVLIGRSEKEIAEKGLRPLREILRSRAVLIANRNSFREKDLGGLLEPLCKQILEQTRSDGTRITSDDTD